MEGLLQAGSSYFYYKYGARGCALALGYGSRLEYGDACAWLLEGTEARAGVWLRRERENPRVPFVLKIFGPFGPVYFWGWV
ncbi:hypothetical protein V6Z11_A10G257900 [Gossypium hirsutum]